MSNRSNACIKITGYSKISLIFKSKLLCNHIYQYTVIQKLGRDVKSIVLKFLKDQTISLRVNN